MKSGAKSRHTRGALNHLQPIIRGRRAATSQRGQSTDGTPSRLQACEPHQLVHTLARLSGNYLRARELCGDLNLLPALGLKIISRIT